MKKSVYGSALVFSAASVFLSGAAFAGIGFEYFPGEQHNVPDFSSLKADKTGEVPDFDYTLGGKTADENYSIRFQGGLKIEKDAAYTFYTSSDDGTKLWIDDKLVVNNDGDHADQEGSGKIKLAAGVHKIVVGYYQAGGDRALSVSYESAAMAKTAIPKDALSPKAPDTIPEAPKNIAGNLKYEYFEGEWDKLPDFKTLTAVSSGDALGFDMAVDSKVRDENFAIRYTGKIAIDKDGDYSFYVNSDDGANLLIDDKVVVDNDGDHAAAEKDGKVTLTAGSHSISVLYYQHGGEKSLQVSYEGPDISKRGIPDAKLSK